MVIGVVDADLYELRELIRARPPLTVLTGAGASAESGVPTFRGEGGLWRSYDAMDLATPEAFAQDPHLVWEFYQYRRRRVAECQPNPGHMVLARYQAAHPETWIITQNIDDLHHRAGSTGRILEMHGNLWRLRCLRCPYREENRDLSFDRPPICPRCQSLLRPDVVWFGEGFEIEMLVHIDNLLSRGGVMLVIGTSGAVAPAAEFAGIARARGAFTIEINPEASLIADNMSAVVRAPAGVVLPVLLGIEPGSTT